MNSSCLGLSAAYGTTAASLEDGLSSGSDLSDSEGNQFRTARSVHQPTNSGKAIDREWHCRDRIGMHGFGTTDFSRKLNKVFQVEGGKAALKEVRSSR